MLEAKITELKSRLSAYLARVRAGDTVLILDRRKPVARIVPLEGHGLLLKEPSAGGLRAMRPRRSRVRPGRSIDISKLLREDRDIR